MRGITIMCTYRKQFLLFVVLLFSAFSFAQNAIVTENLLPGTDPSDWHTSPAGNMNLEGFATEISVNKGETVRFKIFADPSIPGYTVDIYRLGWYGGDGAAYKGAATVTATLPQIQPAPYTNTTTGLVDYGTWNESAHWNVPVNAVSGIYLAKLTPTNSTVSNHIIFIVRDDASTSDILFQTSDATWHAYNYYGGNSLYIGTTDYPVGHATHVSYNRPFVNRIGGGGGGAGDDFLFNAEYPMLRFLERNGYDVTYFTNVDAAERGNLILNHKAFLSVGHDEYWSKEQRDYVEAARNAGVHLAFFSGNEVYWKTRWENSYDGNNSPYRTLICYKEGSLGENVCGGKCDPSPEWTGLWRSGCEYPLGNGCRPENALTGQISWENSEISLEVPAEYQDLRFWRHTSVESLTSGQKAIFPDGTLGHEWNFEQFPGSYPNGRITLSSTTSISTITGQPVTHKLSLYKHPSGALVFGAGTIQWAFGLDDFHDGESTPTSPDMQQATVNLLADMGIQPGTLMGTLTSVTASTDLVPPVTILSSHTNGQTVNSFAPVTITGTASDADGAVGGVEVSLDGGVTWKAAVGRTNWSYTWTPSVTGPISVHVRGFDDSGNMEAAGPLPSANAINLIVGDPACPCTIFEPSDVPAAPNMVNPGGGIELGLKFRTAHAGYIWGIRFYKSVNNTGVHYGSLWTENGTLVSRLRFNNETASGWQETSFGSPVMIEANTTYIVSYHSPTGNYSETNPYFTIAKTKGPLTAIANNDPDGPNGVYLTTPNPAFPTTFYQSDNYWVDVVYKAESGPDVVAPTMMSAAPANNAFNVSVNSTITATFDEDMDPASINSASFELRDASNNIVPATYSYDALLKRAILTPTVQLNYYSLYTFTLKSGEEGISDIAGNVIPANITRIFHTQEEPPSVPGTATGTGGPILVLHEANRPFSLITTEILKTEGLNAFSVAEIDTVDATELENYDVVIVGNMPLTAGQVTMLSDWTTNGGTLITMRPDKQLAGLLGLTTTTDSLGDGYLLVNTASGPGVGIVNETIQYHGSADLYTLNGATAIATLYTNATTITGASNPAVSVNEVGANGGRAIAFTYDLNRSIVYTRQGNPAYAGQDRDGFPTIRPNDLFFPDYVNLNKVQIPQADEQQRLLANMIIQYNLPKKPLPRFWYLPGNHKAALVHALDDHNVPDSGTYDLFSKLIDNSQPGCSVENWECLRATSYIFENVPLTDAEAVNYDALGFELGAHVQNNVGGNQCSDFTNFSNLNSTYVNQLNNFQNLFPSIPPQNTHRYHCIVWSDWVSQARAARQNGIRLTLDYYYWPNNWVNGRPGLFTGSGMPMRFADTTGELIDVFQGVTQLVNENGIDYTVAVNTLLDNALGPKGFYGMFGTHDDYRDTLFSEAIMNAAIARNVPMITAKQMLTWIDARNNSAFNDLVWQGDTLNFNITAGTDANNLRAMLPYQVDDTTQLLSVSRNGTLIPFTVQTIKGIQYAFVEAVNGVYEAIYDEVTTSSILGQVTLQGRPAAPNAQWEIDVRVELYQNGNPTPVQTYTVPTNSSGSFLVSNIPTGTYTIAVKNSHTLKRIKADQVLVTGMNSIDFGTLLEGDVDDNNMVTLADVVILSSSYNKIPGNPGYIVNADLDHNQFIQLSDLILLLTNYNQVGENP